MGENILYLNRISQSKTGSPLLVQFLTQELPDLHLDSVSEVQLGVFYWPCLFSSGIRLYPRFEFLGLYRSSEDSDSRGETEPGYCSDLGHIQKREGSGDPGSKGHRKVNWYDSRLNTSSCFYLKVSMEVQDLSSDLLPFFFSVSRTLLTETTFQ